MLLLLGVNEAQPHARHGTHLLIVYGPKIYICVCIQSVHIAVRLYFKISVATLTRGQHQYLFSKQVMYQGELKHGKPAFFVLFCFVLFFCFFFFFVKDPLTKTTVFLPEDEFDRWRLRRLSEPVGGSPVTIGTGITSVTVSDAVSIPACTVSGSTASASAVVPRSEVITCRSLGPRKGQDHL